jgi:RNA polymerase sigma-70 factor (ECF subfamily)
MRDNSQSDEELLEAFYACEVAAEDVLFDRLSQRHAAWLMREIRKILFDRRDAEDVLQTVFLKLIRTKRDRSGRWNAEMGTSVRSWFAMILKHELIDRFRRRKLSQVPQSTRGEPEGNEVPEGAIKGRSCAKEITSIDEAADNQLPSFHKPPSPPEAAIRNEMKARVRKACENLPEPHRSILRMKYWKGMSQGEVAELIGVSDATISRRIAQAYEMLRERLPEGLNMS